jgi:hypothetical protein
MFILKRLPKNIKIKPVKSKPIVSPAASDDSRKLFWLSDLLIPPSSLSLKTQESFGPEDRECLDFVMWLRQETIEGRMPYVWFKVPNEYSGMDKPLFGIKMWWLGRVPGCADYIFMGKEKSFCIEMKAETKNYRGKLSERQELFHQWCSRNGVPYHVCYGSKQAQKIVLEHIEG